MKMTIPPNPRPESAHPPGWDRLGFSQGPTTPTTHRECPWYSSPGSPSSGCSSSPRSWKAHSLSGWLRCEPATTSWSRPVATGARSSWCPAPDPAGLCSPTWLWRWPPLSSFMESFCQQNICKRVIRALAKHHCIHLENYPLTAFITTWQPSKRMKWCHFQQHGWTKRLSYWVR